MSDRFEQNVFLGVVGLGIALLFVGSPIGLLLGWCMPAIGLAFYARAKGRTLFWAAMGVVPLFGPLSALAVIGLDDLLAKRSAPKLMRRLAVSIVALCGLALFLAIVIPNFLRFGARSPQSEARLYLGMIYVAETAFRGEFERYGTFDEVNFFVSGNSNRYTYRIDNSGRPGTVVPAKDGTLTPDNTIVHAGVSPDGQSFTATATANLDDDSTLDQWHVNDSQRRPVHDVDDSKL